MGWLRAWQAERCGCRESRRDFTHSEGCRRRVEAPWALDHSWSPEEELGGGLWFGGRDPSPETVRGPGL